MFSRLVMENVRASGRVEYDFQDAKRLYLKGKNGAGKSTVCEALTFTLTGKDSSGGAYPCHLISRGENGLKTIVTIGEWTISRTLTQKKNTTIIAQMRDYPEFKPSQKQLLDALGFSDMDPEIYIAATIPGFFMAQHTSRRFAMLAIMMPRFDRVQFVADYSGMDAGYVDKLCNGFVRGIPSSQNYAPKRIELQKEKARCEGRIEELLWLKSMDMDQPEEPVEVKLLPLAQQYMQDVNDYTNAYAQYMGLVHQRNYVILESERRNKLKADIEKRLENLVIWEPLMDMGDIPFDKLSNELKKTPDRPSVMDLPSSGRCHVCGQVVGSRLREQIEDENARMIADYENACEEVRAHNAEVQKRIVIERARLNSAIAHNDRVRAQMKANLELDQSLRQQLLSIEPVIIPEEPQAPIKPKIPMELVKHGIGPYKKDIIRLQDAVHHYIKKVGIYEKQLKSKEVDDDHIAKLEKAIEKFSGEVKQWEKFEQALKMLPQQEAAANKSRLYLEHYIMDFTDGFDIRHVGGTPYECMSAGEKITLDVALCVKFQQLLPKRPGWIFVDDADLLQKYEALAIPEDIQVFFAQVIDTDSEVVSLQTF